MTLAKHISAGMTLNIDGEIFSVENQPVIASVGAAGKGAAKPGAAKQLQLVKVSLLNLFTLELIEKRFNPEQTVQEVPIIERDLEFLYPEGKEYLFLDIKSLEIVHVPANILGKKIQFLKEGIGITAQFYGDRIFSGKLLPFLELMVVKTEGGDPAAGSSATKIAHLETGAKVVVPLFIEAGDVLKIDTQPREEDEDSEYLHHAYVQRT